MVICTGAPQRYLGGTVGTTSEVLKTRQVRGTCAIHGWMDGWMSVPTYLSYIQLHTYNIHIVTCMLLCYDSLHVYIRDKIEEHKGTFIRQ